MTPHEPQRWTVFSGTYDNCIDPRKDPDGDFCYWFDVEPIIAERDELKVRLEKMAEVMEHMTWKKEAT